MTEKILTTRRQKYPFKTMAINDTFRVKDGREYYSMRAAYKQHNKAHPDLAIVIQCARMGTGFIQVKRTA
jgi:hypothetical protein